MRRSHNGNASLEWMEQPTSPEYPTVGPELLSAMTANGALGCSPCKYTASAGQKATTERGISHPAAGVPADHRAWPVAAGPPGRAGAAPGRAGRAGRR